MDGMYIFEISQETVNLMEEENRQDVIALVVEIAKNIIGDKEVNLEVAEEVASRWFEKHKNHLDEFGDELTEFSEALAKRIAREKSKWIKK